MNINIVMPAFHVPLLARPNVTEFLITMASVFILDAEGTTPWLC